MTEKLKALTEAIQKANPELLKANKNEARINMLPITLEHILKTLDGMVTHYVVEPGGGFTDECNIDAGLPPVAYWQLGKPLHEQPTETIDFLHDLICKS